MEAGWNPTIMRLPGEATRLYQSAKLKSRIQGWWKAIKTLSHWPKSNASRKEERGVHHGSRHESTDLETVLF